MNTIVPAVIPQSFDHALDAIHMVASFTNEIQIDIVDGHFVHFTSWPYRGSGSVMLLNKQVRDMTIEVDLMIDEPEKALPIYVDAGVQKVVIHLESTKHFADIVDHHRSHTYALGLAISNDTSLDSLISALPYADYVQLMGIRSIGSQGQSFDETVLNRITLLRKQFPELTISIDGSVNAETLPLLKQAGANRFVSGSAIFGATDPKQAYETLTSL